MEAVAMNRSPLAERIVIERASRDWTQADLAQEAGISPATVVLLETGLSKTRPRTLYLLAKALEGDPAELIRLPQEPRREGKS